MTIGHVRDNFIRVTLTLPGQAGPVTVEFLVDTGFDGELALPGYISNNSTHLSRLTRRSCWQTGRAAGARFTG